jgi:hypothetical protein
MAAAPTISATATRFVAILLAEQLLIGLPAQIWKGTNMSSALSSAESDAKKGSVSAWTPQTRAGVLATRRNPVRGTFARFVKRVNVFYNSRPLYKIRLYIDSIIYSFKTSYQRRDNL